MKLNDTYNKPMKEILDNDCHVVDQKIHTNEDGDVMAIEIKYRPNDVADKELKVPEFMKKRQY